MVNQKCFELIESALNIHLYDWQKEYISGKSKYMAPGRATGKTTAYIIKLCLSEGEPIDMTQRKNVIQYIDEQHSTIYPSWFRQELWEIYSKLKKIPGLYLREIYFSQNDRIKKVTRTDGLTNDEGKVMDALITAWNQFYGLDMQHPDERRDFADGIHKCQDLLAVRIARRVYPEGWPVKK